MLDSLITSKTRIKLLYKLFLNPDSSGHLRGLANEFGESTNSIRTELNRMVDFGLLVSVDSGMRKEYRANKNHPLYGDINNILLKTSGIEDLIESISKMSGDVDQVVLDQKMESINEKGVLINLKIIGQGVNKDFVTQVTKKLNNNMKSNQLSISFLSKDDKVNQGLILWSKEI
ncbi:MAG: ArsR family transcriptional regulator [Flavobacteriales bacterium]|nr:ArsR family transcriptional regulator [Flavobacteriales bacterium]